MRPTSSVRMMSRVFCCISATKGLRPPSGVPSDCCSSMRRESNPPRYMSTVCATRRRPERRRARADCLPGRRLSAHPLTPLTGPPQDHPISPLGALAKIFSAKFAQYPG